MSENIKCCKLDTDNDGNCPIHSAPGVYRNPEMAPKKRPAGDHSNYIENKARDCYECKTCGADILSVEVRRPVWDGPFPCSGSGRVATDYLPYCPNCEDKPSDRGTPILAHPRYS